MSANIDFPCIPVGQQTLYFLPDTLLVLDGSNVGTVNYKNLYINSKRIKFIEDNRIPSDTKIVDQTWKVVNKDGSADKRFKDNEELSIVAYGKLHFKSDSGLNECIHVSDPELSRFFADVLERYCSEAYLVEENLRSEL